MNPCHVCSQIDGDPQHDLIAHLLPGCAYVRRVVVEDAHFAVLPSLGALRPGHLLICPREHVRSLAALPAARMIRLQRMVRRVHALLCPAGCGDELLLFEHGSAADGGRTACSVDHAHLHAVPVPAGLAGGLLPQLAWQSLASAPDALARTVGGAEYLLQWRHGGRLRVALAPPGGHPSQAMRRALAERLQPAPPWNWRDAPDAGHAHATWARLAAH